MDYIHLYQYLNLIKQLRQIRVHKILAR